MGILSLSLWAFFFYSFALTPALHPLFCTVSSSLNYFHFVHCHLQQQHTYANICFAADMTVEARQRPIAPRTFVIPPSNHRPTHTMTDIDTKKKDKKKKDGARSSGATPSTTRRCRC